MAIATYSDLQAAVLRWVARDDLSPYLPDFISLAEVRLFQGAGEPLQSDPLRVRQMLKTTIIGLDSGMARLPSDLLQMQTFYIDGMPVNSLDATSPDALRRLAPFNNVGQAPRLYAIDGANVVTRPGSAVAEIGDALLISEDGPEYLLISEDGPQYLLISDSLPGNTPALTISYYAKPAALSAGAGLSILADYPNCYLYATLIEAALFLMEDARATSWHALLKAAVAGANLTDQRRRRGAGTSQMRPMTWCP